MTEIPCSRKIDLQERIQIRRIHIMSEQCTPSACSTCGSNCASRQAPNDFMAHLAKGSSVKHVYAVMSGKGGVGKSLVTSLLASAFSKKGNRVAVLDADVTGPSIPRAFAIDKNDLYLSESGLMVPPVSRGGVHVLSSNLLLQHEDDPVLWRGSLIASAIKQFYSESLWDDIDYMFVDMPPGTGDVPLTVFQSLPVEGIIMVTSPQDLVSMIVGKAVNMARKMNIPVLGIVENMSYVVCPDCGRHINVFGESHIEDVAASYGLSVLAKLPIDPEISAAVDDGLVETLNTSCMDKAVAAIEAIDSFTKDCFKAPEE